MFIPVSAPRTAVAVSVAVARWMPIREVSLYRGRLLLPSCRSLPSAPRTQPCNARALEQSCMLGSRPCRYQSPCLQSGWRWMCQLQWDRGLSPVDADVIGYTCSGEVRAWGSVSPVATAPSHRGARASPPSSVLTWHWVFLESNS